MEVGIFTVILISQMAYQHNIAVFFTFQTLSIKYLVNKNYYIQSDDLPPSTTGVEGIAEHFFFLLLTQEYKTAW